MASTYLHKNQGTPTNAKKFTVSCWFKRCSLGTEQRLFQGYKDSNDRLYAKFETNDKLMLFAAEGGTDRLNWKTSMNFRDVNAWYHLVLVGDSTESTEADRIKLYINGVRQTEFTKTTTSMTLNMDWGIQLAQTNQTFTISGTESHSQLFDGLMSHFHYVDGTAYQASTFGSTDATTGEWKINTNPTLTMGTNGFTILKDGMTVTDQSSNSNDWAVGAGTLTKTEDNPSNVFCTMNPLANCYGSNLTISKGNNSLSESSNTWQMRSATLGASAGKYYYEYKITTLGTGNGYHKLGFLSDQAFSTSAGHGADPALDGSYVFYCVNGQLEVRTDNAVITGYDTSTLGISFSLNDIMCLAVDMDNKRAYFRKNDGAWIKSGDPANGTNGLDISSDYPANSPKCMIPAISIYHGGAGSVNFGNGYFGEAAIASEGTNASGNGKFEYDVPTGFTALSTKGLNL